MYDAAYYLELNKRIARRFFETLFRQIKYYIDFGDLFGGDNTFFDFLYTRMYIGSIPHDDYYVSAGNLIDKINDFMTDPVEWASIKTIYRDNVTNWDALKIECIAQTHNKGLCTAYANAIQTNSAVKECFYDPYTNEVKDCVKLFYSETYPFKHGVEIYDSIDNVNWEN